MCTPYKGTRVADVALTNDDCFLSVGCHVLKSILKLSYAKEKCRVCAVFQIRPDISFEMDFTMFSIDLMLIDKPACASISMTFSGTQVE